MKILLLFVVSFFANAEIVQDVNFNSPELQNRYHILIDEIRCPVCQGQSIGGSNAPLALDLRNVVIKMLKDGKSDEEIFDFMKQRYGNFVVFEPPVNNQTYILWLAPPLFAIIAIIMLMRSKKPKVKKEIDISTAENLLK